MPSTRPSLRLARPAATLAAAAALMTLAACGQDQAKAPAAGQAPPRVEVSAMTLHPRSVAITAELPGRTAAALVAEVRPQVGGLIRTRLFKEGSDVQKDDVLYEIDPASYQAAYDSAAAAQQKAEAAVPSAQARVDRYQGLAKQNSIASQDVDDARATLAQAVAEVASAKAALETARINLSHTRITAPIGGRIGASAVSVGALVSADQTTVLTTIRQLNPINVDVTQSSTNLLKFRNAVDSGQLKTFGPNVSVRLKLEDGTTYGQKGNLAFAEANVDQSTGTFTVRAEFPNPDRILLPGMYVRATIEEGIAENGFLVPQRAVTRTPRGEATAKFVTAEGKVEDRPLAVQRAIGNNWLVQGIKDGDRVIVEGGQRVRAGQEVTVADIVVDDATGELRPAVDAPKAN